MNVDDVDPTDDALRDHLRRHAAAATITSSPRPLIEARARRIRTRRRRTRWAVVAAVLLLSVGGVLVAVQALTSHPDEMKIEDSGPTTSMSTTTLSPAISQALSDSPPPSYPEGVRGPLVEAFNALSFCMHNHGVSDYPILPDNFGDGTVPVPVENGDSPNMATAIEACRVENEAARVATLIANGHPELVGPTLTVAPTTSVESSPPGG